MANFEVLQNIKHDGTLYKIGDFIEGEIEQFAHLVKDSILRMKGEQTATAPVEAKAEPQNTWEAKKEETVAAPVAPVSAPVVPAVVPIKPYVPAAKVEDLGATL